MAFLFQNMAEGKMRSLRIVAMIASSLLATLIMASCTTVGAGKVGVITSFGSVQDASLSSGIHLIAPWKRSHEMSVRVQEHQESADVPTSEGLVFTLEASLIYYLDQDSATEMYRSVGENYLDVLIVPQMRSEMRRVTAGHQAKDLYTSGRAEIESAVENALRQSLSERGIVVQRVLLRSLSLPDKVKSAIESKLAADQASQQMEFVLTKEKKEAERKVIEAEGIAAAQEKIHATLTENYIKYLWVKALENNATHPSTVIYVPIGSDGLPIVARAGQGK